MKTLVLSLFITAFLFSCDPNSDKRVGDADRFRANSAGAGTGSGGATGSGTTGSTGSSNAPTDAPLDGGLGVLLIAGTAYGIKRFRAAKPKENA